MDEIIKGRIIIILAVIILILFIFNIGSCVNAYNQNAGRKKEMFWRMDLEEKMSRFTQEKAGFAEKFKAKDKELEEEKASHQAAKNELERERLVSQGLKSELEKANKLKDVLEEDLKRALTAGKKVKK